MATRLEIVRVPVLSDNYAWLIHDSLANETVVVDPGEAEPVLAAAAERGWNIGEVWITHWHPDHTGGNQAMHDAGAAIVGPEAERSRIPALGRGIAEGDVLRIGDHAAQVWHVPGHTSGHVAFVFAGDAAVFTGDTLFAMGCGRLFEGTPAEMFANMQRYADLPPETRVYGGHEYTLSNGRFALTVEPQNAALRQRMTDVEAMRAADEPTLPTTIALERETNPFLRADSVDAFARLRSGKDSFSG